MSPQRAVRLVRWLIVLLPVSVAVAQVLPPPPPGPLPPPPQPPGNPVTTAKARLGKALFWDEQLSSSRTVACGTCHQAASGGSDPRSLVGSARATHPGPDGVRGTADDVTGSPGVSLAEASGRLAWSTPFGILEQVTSRRAPSHIDAAYAPELFWDGRATPVFVDPATGDTLLRIGGALESQSVAPPVSSSEMAHLGRDWANVAARVQASTPLALAAFVPGELESWIGGRSYPELFAEAFGTPGVTPARIAMAVASYERTLFSNQTPFDSALAGQNVLTPPENAGRQLFGTLPCARCHAGALTSDNAFHYIGESPAAEDSGRIAVTGRPADLGAFRTPSLRNVALRKSYMHDGRFRSLEEVVDFYDRGGDFNAPNRSPLITPLNLTPLQKSQLLAFLRRPLTDPRVAASQPPFDRPSLFSESNLVPLVTGQGTAGQGGLVPQVVALQPALLGNATFTIGLYGARPDAEAVLVIDDQQPPTAEVPPAASFARVSATTEAAGGEGFTSATVAIPNDASLAGRTLHGRWYVTDPDAFGGVAMSAPFEFTVFGAHPTGLATGVPTGPASVRVVRLHAGQPNPFATRTTLRYEVMAPTPVRLTLYDLAGREVRRLVRAPMQAPGTYSVTWDGRDEAGRTISGGVYFARLEAGGASDKARLVRLP